MITISNISDEVKKSEITELILRRLPDWFELEQGILDYMESVKNLPFFVAKNDDKVVGFIAIDDLNKFASEIHVMGVLPEYRGNGIGRKLVEFVWNRNMKMGVKYLTVKTLDESAGDRFYEETRKFYKAMNFVPIMMSTEIWGEKNPCVIMLRYK